MLNFAMTVSMPTIHKSISVTLNVLIQAINRPCNVLCVRKLKNLVCHFNCCNFTKSNSQNMVKFIEFFSVQQTIIIVRTCHWEKNNALRNECYKENINTNGTSHGKIVFCETCDSDGCNRASNQSKLIAILISPLIVVKILLF